VDGVNLITLDIPWACNFKTPKAKRSLTLLFEFKKIPFLTQKQISSFDAIHRFCSYKIKKKWKKAKKKKKLKYLLVNDIPYTV
jgi:hypothetical protein